MKIVGVGLGLIGGSMLLGLRQIEPKFQFLGVDTNANHLAEALDLKIIEKQAEDKDFADANVVIVSIPVDLSPKIIHDILEKVGEKTLVLDTGSTKNHICRSLAAHPKRDQYLATHPIAGTEFSGPKAAFPGLFTDKTMIICESKKTRTQLQSIAIGLFEKMQMTIRHMHPQDHDQHIAYVSHLSHISSFMLGKTVIEKEQDQRDIFDLAGSGFASTVRLAKSHPQTWTSIFKDNKKEVLEALNHYIKNLESFQKTLQNDDYQLLYQEMNHTNQLKDILKGIKS